MRRGKGRQKVCCGCPETGRSSRRSAAAFVGVAGRRDVVRGADSPFGQGISLLHGMFFAKKIVGGVLWCLSWPKWSWQAG